MESQLKLKCFSPLRILTFPLFEQTLRAFLFLPLFLFFQYVFSLFSLFSMLHLLGFLMIFEEKIYLFKFSFQMKWYGHNCGYTGGDAYSGMELCMPI
jgi:hypothetical protein